MGGIVMSGRGSRHRGSWHALFTSSLERLDAFFVCFFVTEGFHSAAHYVRSVVSTEPRRTYTCRVVLGVTVRRTMQHIAMRVLRPLFIHGCVRS